MVAIYCSFCVGVFPNISALHGHIKKHVPDGSYTFDFKSQIGYPSNFQFPFIDISDIKKKKLFKDKLKILTQKRNGVKGSVKGRKGTKRNSSKRTKVNIPSLINEGKTKTDRNSENEKEGNLTLGVIDSVTDIKLDPDIADADSKEDVIHDDDDFHNDDDDYDESDDAVQNTEVFEDTGNNTDILNNICIEKDEKKNENDREIGEEAEGFKRPLRNCSKRVKTIQFPISKEKLEFQDLGVETKYKGTFRKKYINCEVCGAKKEQSNLIDHIEAVHSNETLSQSLLTKLRELRRLKAKRKSKLSEEDKEYRVNIKKKSRPYTKKIKKETDSPPTPRPKVNQNELLPCYICGALVKRCRIKVHVRYHSDVKPFECEICKKKYITKAFLKNHQKCSHGERKFKCTQCSMKFIFKSQLDIHVRTHSDERQFTCPKCGKGFKIQKGLDEHLRTHTGIKRFACEKCGQKFLRTCQLKMHIKAIHDQVKDWICSWPNCAKCFTSAPMLRRHMIIHSGEKPVKCNHCDAGFTQRPELKIHLLKKHGIHIMPPPTNSSHYGHLPHILIKNPLSKEGEKASTMNTFFFPSQHNNPFEGLFIKYINPSGSIEQTDAIKQELDTAQKLPDPVKTSVDIEETRSTAHQSKDQNQTEPSEHVLNHSEAKVQHSETTEHSDVTAIDCVQREEDIEAVARLATSSALEAINFNEPMGSSHITSSSSAEYHQLLFSPFMPVSSLMKVDPEVGTSQEHSWFKS